jgi:hypothetical protein
MKILWENARDENRSGGRDGGGEGRGWKGRRMKEWRDGGRRGRVEGGGWRGRAEGRGQRGRGAGKDKSCLSGFSILFVSYVLLSCSHPLPRTLSVSTVLCGSCLAGGLR